ncbi:MAG: radical SAM protein [Candidatus Riflebacteria bacterium]|nr:radical SAM protein [Candidatus Riflebacteria bacterium]
MTFRSLLPPDLERERITQLWKLFDPCRLCPRMCGAHRYDDGIGVCGAGRRFKVASWAAHRGEEPPISGERGSGTIFASHCPMKCCFCQNYPFSQLGNGREMDIDEVAEIFVSVAQKGVHNLNFVTPTHFTPHLFDALARARPRIGDLPVVYNTSGYENIEVLKLLDGLVDIYLPDLRYADNAVAAQLSKVSDYVERDRAAILEMARQVGADAIEYGSDGIARRGMIIRHLVLPGGLAGTASSLNWLRDTLGTKVALSLMCQYFPAHQATTLPGLDRGITVEEYSEALDIADSLGFENAWAQDPDEIGGA